MNKSKFNVDSFPVLYSAYAPYLNSLFPGKSEILVQDITEYIVKCSQEFPFKLDFEQYRCIDNTVQTALVPYIPDAVYYAGQIHFKNQKDYDKVASLG